MSAKERILIAALEAIRDIQVGPPGPQACLDACKNTATHALWLYEQPERPIHAR